MTLAERNGTCNGAMAHRELLKIYSVIQPEDRQLTLKPAPDPEGVKQALGYLWQLFDKKESSRHASGANAAKCLRYLFYAIDVLSKAPDAFTLEHEMFWGSLGTFAGHAIKDSKDCDRANGIFSHFSTRFIHDHTTWPLRERILNGFACLTAHITDRSCRTQAFRDFFEYALAYCEPAVACCQARVPESVTLTTRSLVRAWSELAEVDGWAEDVRPLIAKNALRILKVIVPANDVGNLSAVSIDALEMWGHMLKRLIHQEGHADVEHTDRYMIQSYFNTLANHLGTIRHVRALPAIKNWWAEILADLIPFLHGQKRQGIRLQPLAETYCTVTIGDLGRFRAKIHDVCGKTFRGFQIHVPALRLDKVYGDRVPPVGHVDGKFPCCKVHAVRQDAEGQFHEEDVEQVTIELAEICPQAPAVQCSVLRAWPLPSIEGKMGSGWALLAPASTPLAHHTRWESMLQSWNIPRR